MFEDKEIVCKDCQNKFAWTARDQEFYQEKGYSAPQRCKDCRMKFKQQRDNRDNQQKFEITCSQCGKQDTVTFEPRDPSTILCTECFYKKRDAERAEKQAGTEKEVEKTEKPVKED